jgi:hypothetical protein
MDPYLEEPDVWRGVHARLISCASDLLQPQLRPLGFYVDIDERIWLEEPQRAVYPDLAVIRRPMQPARERGGVAVLEADEPVLVRAVSPSEVRETFLQVFDLKGRRLITQIELISPANKAAGHGRDQFIAKREELQAAGVNVVEIDLLRSGPPVVDLPASALAALRPWHYLITVRRKGSSDHEVYPVVLQNRLPRIRIPLTNEVSDVVLDLQSALDRAYDTGPYPERIDYGQPAVPPLLVEDDAWAAKILAAAGLRPTS